MATSSKHNLSSDHFHNFNTYIYAYMQYRKRQDVIISTSFLPFPSKSRKRSLQVIQLYSDTRVLVVLLYELSESLLCET